MALGTALGFTSAGLNVLGGFFGYMEAQQAARGAESRADLLRLEAEVDAQRYAEKAERFKTSQKMSFLKSGVLLTGSPLDVLDETTRITSENLSALRMRGKLAELEARNKAVDIRNAGRMALLQGFAGATGTLSGMGMFSGMKYPGATPSGVPSMSDFDATGMG